MYTSFKWQCQITIFLVIHNSPTVCRIFNTDFHFEGDYKREILYNLCLATATFIDESINVYLYRYTSYISMPYYKQKSNHLKTCLRRRQHALAIWVVGITSMWIYAVYALKRLLISELLWFLSSKECQCIYAHP